ncbi:unnamed protein product [Caretta caretta]
MLWDLNEGKHLYMLDSGDINTTLCFSPNLYWLCAATGGIKIWHQRSTTGVELGGTNLFGKKMSISPIKVYR